MYILQADGISSTSGIAASSWMMAVRKKYTHFVWEDSNFFVSMPHSLLFVRVILTRRYGPNQLLLLCRYSDKHCEYENSNCVLYVCIVFASRANLRFNFGLVLEAPLFINSIFKWTLGGLQLLLSWILNRKLNKIYASTVYRI